MMGVKCPEKLGNEIRKIWYLGGKKWN